MINVIERFNFNWENGEKSKYCIEYLDYNNKRKNYFPDFILNNKYMIEVKPKSLINNDIVIRKKEAALIWCKNHNLIYKLSECKKLTTEEIKNLRNNNIIKFIDRYESKFKEKYKA